MREEEKILKGVLFHPGDPELKAIGFILPNEGSDLSLQSFAVTVDEVEEATGIDFYPRLPDDVEEVLESTMDVSDWNFTEFIPTGEEPDPSQLEYTAPEESAASKVLDMAIGVFTDIKVEVFDMLGISALAEAAGLI